MLFTNSISLFLLVYLWHKCLSIYPPIHYFSGNNGRKCLYRCGLGEGSADPGLFPPGVRESWRRPWGGAQCWGKSWGEGKVGGGERVVGWHKCCHARISCTVGTGFVSLPSPLLPWVNVLAGAEDSGYSLAYFRRSWILTEGIFVQQCLHSKLRIVLWDQGCINILENKCYRSMKV